MAAAAWVSRRVGNSVTISLLMWISTDVSVVDAR